MYSFADGITSVDDESMISLDSFNFISDDQKDKQEQYEVVQEGKRKKYVCKLPGCQKAFRFKSEMDRHIFSHSQERPHKCTFSGCNKEFKRMDGLENHIRSQHTGEAPLVCPYADCELRFTTEAKYRYHLVSHFDEKPYKCTFPNCGKSFATNSQLKQHKQSNLAHRKLDGSPESKKADSTSTQSNEEPLLAKRRNVNEMPSTLKKVHNTPNDMDTKSICLTSPSETETKEQSNDKVLLKLILSENEILKKQIENSDNLVRKMANQINEISKALSSLHGVMKASEKQEALSRIPNFQIAPVPHLNWEVDSYLFNEDWKSFEESKPKPIEQSLLSEKLQFLEPNFSLKDFCFTGSSEFFENYQAFDQNQGF